MKKEDIGKTKAGELEEVTGFHYVPGSICRLSANDDDRGTAPGMITSNQMTVQKLANSKKISLEKRICCRCLYDSGREIKVKDDGYCPECGTAWAPKF